LDKSNCPVSVFTEDFKAVTSFIACVCASAKPVVIFSVEKELLKFDS
jgi:hypothetical protein